MEQEAYYLYYLRGFGIPKIISYGISGNYKILVEHLNLTFKDCLNIIALTNVRLENLFYYFNDFIENANNPINDVKISLNETTTITLPKNICYILVPEDNSYYDNLPYYVSNIAFEVNVVLEKIEKVPSDKEFKHIKYENLLDIIAQSKEKFYLDENKWKIFDEFKIVSVKLISSKSETKLHFKWKDLSLTI